MNSRQHPVRIFLVGSEFFRSSGGIQYVNRLLLAALADWAQKTPSEIHAFSFGDDTPQLPATHAHPSVRWFAAAKSRFALARALAAQSLRTSPHIVLFTHVHLLRLARLVRWLAPRACRAVLGHGIEVWSPLPGSLLKPLRQAHQVVAPSAYTREKLIEVHGVSPERISVIHHGLEPGLAPDPPSSNDRPPLILSVARLNRADAPKGVDVVLRAMPEVLRQCPAARYLIIGDGDDCPRLQSLARSLGLERSVDFRGEARDAELRAAYRSASVFVLPSTKEGFGIVFVEAMNFGLPVVAARAAGALDVIENGVNGLLVPPNDPHALAACLTTLLHDPARRHTLAEAGRLTVASRFLFPHFASRWHDWLPAAAPEAVYLARHAAVFAPSPSRVTRIANTD